MTGRLIGLGTGPGDPELLTLKAVRALGEADVVAHFAKSGRPGNARAIVAAHVRADAIELPLLYPVTTEIEKTHPDYARLIAAFFDEAAAAVAAHLDAGRTVAVLSEGDPFFYGSYAHLHVRLAQRYPTEVVPGVTAMSGCWSALGLPVVQGTEALTVLAGTLPEAELRRRLGESDACVIMKLGRHVPKVRRALEETGRLEEALYVERGTTARMTAVRLCQQPDADAPYFSLVLVPGRKPGG
jgi:precorrin-2/cobalt-factor-2 C20-methyltransferase